MLAEPGFARTDAPTRANERNLSPAFLEGMRALYGGGASPDRADALVWAVTDLLIDGGGAGPRVRAL